MDGDRTRIRRSSYLFRMSLSDQATRFLRFAAEALIKDPPRSSTKEYSGDEYGPNTRFWVDSGEAILKDALWHDRIKEDMETRGVVSFPTIMRILADIGHRYLLGIGFKG